MVLATTTYFYFDHPSEPDPDERGMVWAAQSVDDSTVFTFSLRKLLEDEPDYILGIKCSKVIVLVKRILFICLQTWPV